jgi:high affinity sulfate transporter 1
MISTMPPRLLSALAPSLHGYQRAWLAGDAVAALTLLVIAVPEQLATSRLAGMPPVTGFYAFIAGAALFALLGTNPQMSVGADSTIAPLFAVGVGHLAAAGSTRYYDLVAILAVMVGLIVGLVWLLRLGWIAEFLSAPIITGFLAGVAVVIVVHQLPDLLGISGASGSTLHRLWNLAGRLGSASGWTLAIGAGVFAIVLGLERVSRRLPGALVAVVASTVLVAAAHLHSHGVAVLGAVAHGAPHFGLSGLTVSAIGRLAPIAGVVALVVVSQSAATTRAFADQGGYAVDVGRDLLGVGAGSVVAGLAGAFPVNASPPRTAAVAAAGGRTQAAPLLAAAGVALVIPAVGALHDLPLATLAGVLMFVATRVFHLGELRSIARFDKVELGLALVTLVTVALVGVEQGIGVAVGLAILDRTRRSARPQLHVLGRIPGTTSWAPVRPGDDATELPGVRVLLFATPLWYANAVHFAAEFRAAIGAGGAASPPRHVVLDVAGMSDLDFTGARALGDVLDDLDRAQITLAVARAADSVRRALERAGLLARIGADHLYDSVDEAVRSA